VFAGKATISCLSRYLDRVVVMCAFIPSKSVFPPISQADSDGLLACGGLVVPELILDALTHGIFPWTMQSSEFPSSIANRADENALIELTTRFLYKTLSPVIRNSTWNGYSYDSLRSLADAGDTLCWFAPDPRGIIELDDIHIPSRLQRKMRNGRLQVTFDQAFPEVMLGCALAGKRQEEPGWIYKEFFCGYCKLFELGFAHSVECWLVERDNVTLNNHQTCRKLVGGVYGVAINAFFAGESMFSIETDSSKIALFNLLLHLREKGFLLFDLQVLNSHTESLGGKNIPRCEYMERLKNALKKSVVF